MKQHVSDPPACTQRQAQWHFGASSILAAMLLAVSLSACGGAHSATRCSSDEGCKNGYVCVDNACKPPSDVLSDEGTCTSNQDCNRGEACDGGMCHGSNSSTCVTDLDCPAADFCQGGVCKPRSGTNTGSQCTRNNDCTLGQYCNTVTSRCVECLNDDQCDSGKSCRNNSCTSGSGACTNNFDCNGRVCNTSNGQCVTCMTSGDCPSGQTCRQNQCAPTDDGQPRCTSQADCNPYGKICNSSTGRCAACENNAQCGTGKVCNNGTCTNDTTSTPPGPGSCQERADCAGQQACWGNVCQPCSDDFMCFEFSDLLTGGKICEAQKCVDAECEVPSDCPAGQGCWGVGHCGPCIDAEECRAGEICDIPSGQSEGTCKAPTQSQCTRNADCTNRYACIQSQCRPCTSSSQCGSGETCMSNGTCQASQTSCTSSAQCSGGQVCTSGACANCTSSTQCGSGQTCNASGRCESTTSGGTGAFGASCTSNAQCGAGLVCFDTGTGGGKCSRPCIGSGKGGDADCPSGYGCINFDSGSLDGVQLCVHSTQTSASTPGHPFTDGPGDACSTSSNDCQTGVCYSSSSTCARACMANRDCDSGEVCWAVADNSGVMSGYHLCVGSDTATYAAAGETCASSGECDSGLCVGECANGDACNSSADCASGSCGGVCRDHCRANSDCGSGQTCNPWPVHIESAGMSGFVPACQPRYFNGTKTNGASCTDDSECASDWCVSNICTSPCAITADCTGALASKHCTPVSFSSTASSLTYGMSFCL